MAIYLVQHGQAVSEENDAQRPLAAIGIKETSHIASVAGYYMVPVEQIIHSDKLRARQTAEIFANKLKPVHGLQQSSDMAPDSDIMPMVEKIRNADNLMLVGHLPFLQKLLAFMLTGNSDHQIMKFQYSGIICLEKDGKSDRWQIKWTLSRHIS